MPPVTSQPPQPYLDALKARGFLLENLLGSGGYGSVYRAQQISLGRSVAVKFFDRPHSNEVEQAQRHAREAKLLARVSHPGIPYVITTGQFKHDGNEIPYTVMEYVQGTSLAALIRESEGLDIARACEIVEQVLGALQAAHEAGVIHRDVKPDNILVSPFITYLIDFSIGFSIARGEPGMTRITGTGSGLGTYEYSAPEQLKNPALVDARADIFSAGMVLYEAVAGIPPVPTLLERYVSRLEDPDLQNVLRRALQPDPLARFASAREFQDALTPFVGRVFRDHDQPSLSLCPNLTCSGADTSSKGYIRGPRVVETQDRYCALCGQRHTRVCGKCGKPFPPNLRELIITASKEAADTRTAFCGRCGTLLFETPVCKQCGSFLDAKSVTQDTAESGCTKCRRKLTYGGYGGTATQRKADEDEDIPF